jgi:hypothetical protein
MTNRWPGWVGWTSLWPPAVILSTIVEPVDPIQNWQDVIDSNLTAAFNSVQVSGRGAGEQPNRGCRSSELATGADHCSRLRCCSIPRSLSTSMRLAVRLALEYHDVRRDPTVASVGKAGECSLQPLRDDLCGVLTRNTRWAVNRGRCAREPRRRGRLGNAVVDEEGPAGSQVWVLRRVGQAQNTERFPRLRRSAAQGTSCVPPPPGRSPRRRPDRRAAFH